MPSIILRFTSSPKASLRVFAIISSISLYDLFVLYPYRMPSYLPKVRRYLGTSYNVVNRSASSMVGIVISTISAPSPRYVSIALYTESTTSLSSFSNSLVAMPIFTPLTFPLILSRQGA